MILIFNFIHCTCTSFTRWMKGNLFCHENCLKYLPNDSFVGLKYIFSAYPMSQLTESERIHSLRTHARTHAPPPHIFFLDCPWSAAPTNCIVKGDRRWQETARFFLLEIAPFGTPKARLKNTPRPKIVVQRATLSTVLDDDAVWRWQVSLAPAERLTFPFRRFAASPFHLSIYIIHCFSNLSYRGRNTKCSSTLWLGT